MGKELAVIQINDSSVRVVLGNVIDKKPYVIYAGETPIDNLISRGEIRDYVNLTKLIASFSHYSVEKLKINIEISDAIVILPPNGFEVFDINQSTTVVSSAHIVEQTDINNIISMINNNRLPKPDVQLLDIVPDFYALDNGRKFSFAPIGQRTSSLYVHAKVHLVPKPIYNSIVQLYAQTTIRAKTILSEQYSLASLVKIMPDMPKTYLLVSIDDGLTSLTLVDNYSPIKSQTFPLGYKDLLDKICLKTNLGKDQVKELLHLYGYDDRELAFKPVIFKSQDLEGNEISYSPDDLNKMIKEFMNEYFVQMDACYNSLLNGLPIQAKKLDVVYTGEFITIIGIKPFLEKYFKESNGIHYLSPSTLGARNSKYSPLIGALVASSFKTGSLQEGESRISRLDREENSEKNK